MLGLDVSSSSVKLVDAIRKRVQERTKLTLEEELQGQSFLKEELTPTFRPPSRDVFFPVSRRCRRWRQNGTTTWR